MAVIADLFAIFEQTWVENILRFKHRVSRSLSRELLRLGKVWSSSPDGIDLQPL